MNTKSSMAIVAMLVLAPALGCSSRDGASDPKQLSADAVSDPTRIGAPMQSPMFKIEVLDTNSTIIFQESTNLAAFQLERGRSYNLKVNPAAQQNPSVVLEINEPKYDPNTRTTSLILKETMPIDVRNGITLTAPDNLVNLTYIIRATLPGMPPIAKPYDVGITCTANQSSAFTVNNAAIQVSSSTAATFGSTTNPIANVYDYSAPGIASGTGPFSCSWDFNGDGIRDNEWQPCTNVVRGVYSNHVGERDVRVYVRDDTCNRVKVAHRIVDLAAPTHNQVLALTGSQVFITGTVAEADSIVERDLRLNLRHLSTNPGGNIPAKVNCSYSRSNGKGSFTVRGLHTYPLSGSSSSHGLEITFVDLVDNVDMVAGTGTVDGANAWLKTTKFTTDGAPDTLSRLSFLDQKASRAGTSRCTGTIITTAKEIQGVPCSGGTTGIDGEYLVSAEGTFSCSSLPASNASAKIIDITNGAFFCEYRLQDNCIGAPGGSSGGVPPIQL